MPIITVACFHRFIFNLFVYSCVFVVFGLLLFSQLVSKSYTMNGTQEGSLPCWQDPATAACPVSSESNRRVDHYMRYALRNHTSLLTTQDGEILVWQQRNVRACTSYRLTHEHVLTLTLFGIAALVLSCVATIFRICKYLCPYFVVDL